MNGILYQLEIEAEVRCDIARRLSCFEPLVEGLRGDAGIGDHGAAECDRRVDSDVARCFLLALDFRPRREHEKPLGHAALPLDASGVAFDYLWQRSLPLVREAHQRFVFAGQQLAAVGPECPRRDRLSPGCGAASQRGDRAAQFR